MLLVLHLPPRRLCHRDGLRWKAQHHQNSIFIGSSGSVPPRLPVNLEIAASPPAVRGHSAMVNVTLPPVKGPPSWATRFDSKIALSIVAVIGAPASFSLVHAASSGM